MTPSKATLHRQSADFQPLIDSMVENGGGSESGESGGESVTPKRPHMYIRDESVRTLPFTSAWVPPKVSPPLRTETLRGNVLRPSSTIS